MGCDGLVSRFLYFFFSFSFWLLLSIPSSDGDGISRLLTWAAALRGRERVGRKDLKISETIRPGPSA
jgi:hypothetical protein